MTTILNWDDESIEVARSRGDTVDSAGRLWFGESRHCRLR